MPTTWWPASVNAALSNISPNTGVDKGNPPIRRRFADDLNLGTKVRNYAVAAFERWKGHKVVKEVDGFRIVEID